MFDLLDIGNDLVDGELFRRLPNELMLLAEILRRENFLGASGFKQEAASRDFGFRNCGNGCHRLSPK